jgi:hypothetical protein
VTPPAASGSGPPKYHSHVLPTPHMALLEHLIELSWLHRRLSI